MNYELSIKLTTYSVTRYTFSGKERDEETGYSYFGARYYHPDLSIWLSVDPMSDKYPSLSPYAYCGDNPIGLVDPDGMTVVIVGDDASHALKQLNCSTNLKIAFSEDGKTLVITGGKSQTKADRLLRKAIVDGNIHVEIEASSTNLFTWSDGSSLPTKTGGGYGGNQVNKDKSITAFQKVVPTMLDKMDNDVEGYSSGLYMLHEVSEAYFGGKIAQRKGIASPREGIQGSTYHNAHKMANRIAGGEHTLVTNKIQYATNPFNKKPLYDVYKYWSRTAKATN